MTSHGPSQSFFSGCAFLAMTLFEALLGLLLFFMALSGGFTTVPGGPTPLFLSGPLFQVGTANGLGSGPGGAATATPRPSPTATPVPTPRVTPVPTLVPTPTPTPGGGGGGVGGPIPPITSRSIHGGQVHASVSGLFAVDADVAIDLGTSSAGEFETWLYYGSTDLQTVRVGIFLGEPPYVQIGRGTFTAQSSGDQCAMQVAVTSTSISGHISCTGVSAYDLAASTSGTVTIELDFSADS